MRKSLWIVVALLVVISVPVAHADSFTYTYTDSGLINYSWTTAAIPAVTMATTVPFQDLTVHFTFPGCVITSIVLDLNNAGSTQTKCFNFITVARNDGFTLSDYSTPGTYKGAEPGTNTTLVVTDVTTAPEPSSVALIPIGLGALLLMRRRIGHNSPSVV